MKYAFIQSQKRVFPAKTLCRVIGVHPSGFYAWHKQAQSARTEEDKRLLGLIKQSWLESGGIYGYRKVTDDLKDLGETCGKNRVYIVSCNMKDLRRKSVTRNTVAPSVARHQLN